jgi:virginiamycin B lyase
VTAAVRVSIDGGPYALAAGPDGALWVTLVHGGAIARVTTDGHVRVFPVAPGCRPSIITAGPDGAMWFTRNGDDRIGRIS